MGFHEFFYWFIYAASCPLFSQDYYSIHIKVLKNLAFNNSKGHFIAFNTSFYNISNIKTSIFFSTTSFKYFFFIIFYSFFYIFFTLPLLSLLSLPLNPTILPTVSHHNTNSQHAQNPNITNNLHNLTPHKPTTQTQPPTKNPPPIPQTYHPCTTNKNPPTKNPRNPNNHHDAHANDQQISKLMPTLISPQRQCP